MSWIILSIAGSLEVVWAISLKYSHGFSKPVPSIVTVIASVASFYLLAYAMKTLPAGTAYAVWTGIGAVGVSILGIILFKEPLTLIRSLSFCLIIIGIIGLKWNSG